MKVYCNDCKWFGPTKETGHVECRNPENIGTIDDYFSQRIKYNLRPWEINAKNDCLEFTPRFRAWWRYGGRK